MTTHTEYHAALWDLLNNVFRRIYIHSPVHAQFHRGHSFVFFELCAYLICHGFDPWDEWQIQVAAEYLGERFWFDDCFIKVPNKTVTDSMRLCFKLYTDGD